MRTKPRKINVGKCKVIIHADCGTYTREVHGRFVGRIYSDDYFDDAKTRAEMKVKYDWNYTGFFEVEPLHFVPHHEIKKIKITDPEDHYVTVH